MVSGHITQVAHVLATYCWLRLTEPESGISLLHCPRGKWQNGIRSRRLGQLMRKNSNVVCLLTFWGRCFVILSYFCSKKNPLFEFNCNIFNFSSRLIRWTLLLRPISWVQQKYFFTAFQLGHCHKSKAKILLHANKSMLMSELSVSFYDGILTQSFNFLLLPTRNRKLNFLPSSPNISTLPDPNCHSFDLSRATFSRKHQRTLLSRVTLNNRGSSYLVRDNPRFVPPGSTLGISGRDRGHVLRTIFHPLTHHPLVLVKRRQS